MFTKYIIQIPRCLASCIQDFCHLSGTLNNNLDMYHHSYISSTTVQFKIDYIVRVVSCRLQQRKRNRGKSYETHTLMIHGWMTRIMHPG